MSQRPRSSKNTPTRRAKSTNSAPLSMSNVKPLSSSAPTLTLSENELTDTSEITNSLPIPPTLPNPILMSGISGSDTSATTDIEPTPTKRRDKFDKLHDDILEQVGGLGLMLYMVNEADGTLLLSRADPLASKLTAVAKQNPKVFKAIQKYLQGSVYTVLALEVGTICQGLLKNHGIDPIGQLMQRRQEAKEANENDRVSRFPGAVPA